MSEGKQLQVAILAIGDELILGQTVDTNTAHIAAKLTEIGFFPACHMTVEDDQRLIANTFSYLMQRYPIILVTGGLGPTKDDLTRDGLAESLDLELVESQDAWQQIEAFFLKLGRTPTQNNRRQALLPRGARHLDNPRGTAPGIHLPKAASGQSDIFVMPGVPREMKGMLIEHVLPYLLEHYREGIANRFIKTCKVNTFGLGESSLAEKLGDLLDRQKTDADSELTLGTTVSKGIVSVRIRAAATEEEEANRLLASAIEDCKARLEALYFGLEDATLQEVVVQMAMEKDVKIVTAESCTAGMIAAMIGDVPGASQILNQSFVSYANEAKQHLLAVPEASLIQEGAVSEVVARMMAEGALKQETMVNGSTHALALSVSGIAGPGGGTPEKPVGTVCFGLSHMKDGVIETQTMKKLFPVSEDHGSRNLVRSRSARTGLNLLRLALLKI